MDDLENMTKEELIDFIRAYKPETAVAKYYKANKEKVNHRKPCDICGTEIMWRTRTQHYKSKKCKNNKND